jgi:hypothetical protein
MRIMKQGCAVAVLAASISAVGLARSEGRADDPLEAPKSAMTKAKESSAELPQHNPSCMINEPCLCGGTIKTNRLQGPPRFLRRFEVLPPSLQGTLVYFNPNAEGETLRLQEKFAEIFARQDPEPESRWAHFAWLPMQIHVKPFISPGSLRFEWIPNAETNVWRTGWEGVIAGSSEQPDGVEVVVRIWPRMHSTSVKTLLSDYVMETYRFANGRVELIATDAATPRQNLQHFPIMN